jgi:8-oxo-dGTP diphosphatase
MHLVSPRTLLFLRRGDSWLFLRGAPRKWFAGRLNGLGGHIEPGEDVLASARREAREETGLDPTDLRLVGVVHTVEEPPCLLFVVTGELPPGDLVPTDEGEHVWLTDAQVADPASDVVPDVRALLPEIAAHGPGDPLLTYVFTPPDDLRLRGGGA